MAITLKEQKRRVLESLSQNEEMNPTDHVKRKANGTYCVYKPDGSIAKEFDNKKEAEDYAIANHDEIMKEASLPFKGAKEVKTPGLRQDPSKKAYIGPMKKTKERESTAGGRKRNTNKSYIDSFTETNVDRSGDYKGGSRIEATEAYRADMIIAISEMTELELIELNELAPKTMGSYIKKAHKDATDHVRDNEPEASFDDTRAERMARQRTIYNRRKGINRATDKLTKENRDYTAVHVKHGTTKVKGTSSYDAAKNAAKQFGAKGTKGIDVHLHTKEPQRMTEETPAEKLARTKESNRQRANKIVTQQKTQREYRGEPKSDNQRYASALKNAPSKHKKPNTSQWADTMGSDSVSAKGSFANEEVAALLRPSIDEGYYKNIDTNRKEDARLGKKKELPSHIKSLMKRVAKKNMPANSFKTTDVTPKGYGPNESKDMDRQDRASRAEARTRKARRAMQQDRIKQQQALTKPKNESLDEISKNTLKSYIPKAAGSLSRNAQGRALNISANMDKTNKDMKDIYDQRMKVRTKGIHTATQKLAKEDNDIANMIDKTNPGYAKKIAKSKAKIAKDSTPTSRYMSKRKDKLKSMVVKESSASDRVAKKLNDMETQKSFATGKSKIPDYSQRPRNKPYDLSKKVQTVKEAAKKAKDKEMKPETFQDEPTLNNNISKNDSN
tara:strand:- start:4326 stop:6341 length:2016 start_codon:yes stop_codon:yes gene_type:complete